MDSPTNVRGDTGISNPRRFESLKEILLCVLDLPPAERQAALDQACAGDQELRSEIEGLLAHEEMADKILMANVLPHPAFDDPQSCTPAQGSLEAASPSASPRLTGQDISHYKIMELLGEGGWSEVYKAEDTRLGRHVALKFLRHDAVGSEETKARFIREARAIAVMEHPNICTLYAIEEWRGRLFLAMPLIEGQTLKERMRRGSLEPDEVLDIAGQVTLGLEAAHTKGIIHRDIKPSNIIVSANGRAQILDFGIARRSDISEITRSGVILGTVSYMSPEQAQGGAIDNRTDLWSLGVVLFELLTGRRPFDAASDTGTLHAIANVEPPDIHDLRPDLPSGFSGVLRRALAKSKDDRYADASEFRRDLEGLRGSSDGQVGAGRRTPPRWIWRGGWLSSRLRTALILIAVLTAAGGGLWMHHRAELAPNQPRQAGTMRPWTGLSVQAVNSYLATHYGIRDMTGVFVGKVEAGSPAERAGLKVGDVIRTIDGQKIWTMEQAMSPRLEVGEILHMTISRHGHLLSVYLPVEAEMDHGSR